jgi:hypothetical protein
MSNFLKLWAQGAYTSTGFFRMALWGCSEKRDVQHSMGQMAKGPLPENSLNYTAFLCYLWLAAGLIIEFFIISQ